MLNGHPYMAHPTAGPILRLYMGGMSEAADEPEAEGGSVTTAFLSSMFETRLRSIGGVALVAKANAIGASYGRSVAEKFANGVTRAKGMVAAYSARNAAAASGDTKAIRAIVPRVSAAENQIVTSIVKTGEAKIPVNVGSRDVEGKGGYTYRQYADDTIVIIGAPAGHRTGIVLRDGPAHAAILAEIGPFPAAWATPLAAIAKFAAVIPALTANIPGISPVLVADTLRIGARATAAAAAVPGAAATVTGLLAAAGVSAAAGGPPGWLVGAGMAVAAGTVALVGASSARRGRAVEIARKLGIPDAEKIPVFAVRVLKMSSAERLRLGTKLDRILRAKALPLGRNRNILAAKLRIIAAAEILTRAKARRGTSPVPRGGGRPPRRPPFARGARRPGR